MFVLFRNWNKTYSRGLYNYIKTGLRTIGSMRAFPKLEKVIIYGFEKQLEHIIWFPGISKFGFGSKPIIVRARKRTF